MAKKDLKRAAKHSQNVTEMFKSKKTLSVTTSTNSDASTSSATTSAVSKKQQFDNVSELNGVCHHPKKRFLPGELMLFPERLVCCTSMNPLQRDA